MPRTGTQTNYKDYPKAGYGWIEDHLGFSAVQRGTECRVTGVDRKKTLWRGNKATILLPAKLNPGETLFANLVSALRHEGVNLEILYRTFLGFGRKDKQELEKGISSQAFSITARRLWYLYEFLMDEPLAIADLGPISAQPLIDPKKAYVPDNGPISTRHRIKANLPGTRFYSPTVRRTPAIETCEKNNLKTQCSRMFGSIPEEIAIRMTSYLYLSETQSSFEIERAELPEKRGQQFASLLKRADKENFLGKKQLVQLQKEIVAPDKATDDYRNFPIWVGKRMTDARGRRLEDEEIVDYVPPQAADLPQMMEGLLLAANQMLDAGVNPVVTAAAASFGFVLIHPFEDGNGRIHRFLIHNILALGEFTPAGFVLPVSATIKKDIKGYQDLLRTYSGPLKKQVRFSLSDRGEIRISGSTGDLYRFPDLTDFAEALYLYLEKTILRDVPDEARWLICFDRSQGLLEQISRMTEQERSLFIRLVLQGKGHISKSKRDKYFREVSEETISEMENAVNSCFAPLGQGFVNTDLL